jgi:hypothetical protein
MADQHRKDRTSRAALRTVDPPRRPSNGSSLDDDAAARLSPEWLASMLIDVTSHLMNAIDRASRLREPIERIAAAVETDSKAPSSHSISWKAIVLALIVSVSFAIALSMRFRPWSGIFTQEASVAGGPHAFVLNGVRYQATRTIFERRLVEVAPERIRKYWVEIDGRRYPVKQAVALGLDVPRAAFSSSQAIRILREMGFNQGEREP